MYHCAKCKLGVIVNNVPSPIFACDCTRLIIVKPKTLKQKIIKFFFGINSYERVKEKIIMSMEGQAKGSANARL